MNLSDAFWSTTAMVNHGMNALPMEIKFETMLGGLLQNPLDPAMTETKYRIWMTSPNHPAMLYVSICSSAQEHINKIGKNFPSLLKQLVNDSITGRSQIDLVNENPKVASFVARRCDGKSDLLPWFGCRMDLADDGKVVEHLTSLVLCLRREKDNLIRERDEERNKNLDLQRELSSSRKSNHMQLNTDRTDFQNILDSIHCNSEAENTNHSFNPGSNSSASEDGVIPIEFEPPIFEDANISIPLLAGDLLNQSQSTDNPNASDYLSQKQRRTSEQILRGMASYVLCALCPESSRTANPDEDAVMNHIVNSHFEDERTCSGCPTKTDIQDVPSHIRLHMCRMYKCKFCGKQSTKKNLLQTHIRTHTGERPFECDHCKRRFNDPSTLRRHKSIHTGEMKAPCPICGKIISRRDNVKTHMRNNHGIDEVNAEESMNAAMQHSDNTGENTPTASTLNAIQHQLNSSYSVERGSSSQNAPTATVDIIKSDFSY